MRIALGALALSWLGCASAARTADAKVAKFSALAAKHGGVIKLDSRLYDELSAWSVCDSELTRAAATPRDYSLTVALTALGPQFKCAPCRCARSPASALIEQRL